MAFTNHQQPETPDIEEEEAVEYHPPQPRQRASLAPIPRLLRPDSQQPVSPLPPASQTAPDREEPPHPRRRLLRGRPMWFMLLGVLIVIVLTVLIQRVIIPAWAWTQDQWTYGNSRITQMDANVGHGRESHFVALYAHSNIVIIEIPHANPTADHIYILTGFLDTSGTPVVLLSIADVNHDGKPDLIAQVEGSSFEEVLYNTGTAFSTNGE